MTAGPLKLEDGDFWGDPRRTRSEIQSPLMDSDTEALLFDAPHTVAIDSRNTAPTQLLRVATLASLQRLPFREHGVIVAVDLLNNVVQAAKAVPPPTRSVPPRQPGPTSPAPSGMGSETFTIDLRARLDLPWEEGRFQARVILADQLTPPRDIALVRASGLVDPEVERYRAEQRNRTRVPPLMPAPGEWVSYLRDDKTPAVPTEPGMALSLPRLCVLEADTPCWLRGSFRLPVLKRHIVPPGAASGPGTEELRSQWTAEAARGNRLPAAVVPITLVGVGTQRTGPYVWRLVVPVFEALDFRGERPMGTGAFALDMRRLDGFLGHEQSWFVHAFSDTATASPLTVGITHRPRKP